MAENLTFARFKKWSIARKTCATTIFCPFESSYCWLIITTLKNFYYRTKGRIIKLGSYIKYRECFFSLAPHMWWFKGVWPRGVPLRLTGRTFSVHSYSLHFLHATHCWLIDVLNPYLNVETAVLIEQFEAYADPREIGEASLRIF